MARVLKGRGYTCEGCAGWFERANNKQKHCSDQCRFWSKVTVGPDDACWPYNGNRDKDGYGQFSLRPASPGRSARMPQAHRVALAFATSRDVDELTGLVMHSCDNPPCCNPHHLSEGTHRENAHDRDAKGRTARRGGAQCGRSKATEETVFAIRERHALGESPASLAVAFGLSESAVRAMVRRITWRNL